MKSIFIRLILFSIVTLLVLELFFTFVLPAAKTANRIQEISIGDPKYTISKLDKNSISDGIFTVGQMAQYRYEWHVNNAGYLCSYDYIGNDLNEKPIIAVLGNSFIEGYYTNYGEHLVNYLSEFLNDEYAVYNFGISGEGLSQQLEVLKFIDQNYNPDIILIYNSMNMLSTSVRNLGKKTISQVHIQEDQIEITKPSIYNPSTIGLLVKKSSLFRYLVLNVRFRFIIKKPFKKKKISNSSSNGNHTVELLDQSTNYLIDIIGSTYSDKNIIFFTDPDINSIYSDKPEISEASRIVSRYSNKYDNIYNIDLTEGFYLKYVETNKEYNFPSHFNFNENAHWNRNAHYTAARIIANYINEQ
jgi:hypothetical protein